MKLVYTLILAFIVTNVFAQRDFSDSEIIKLMTIIDNIIVAGFFSAYMAVSPVSCCKHSLRPFINRPHVYVVPWPSKHEK